MRTSLLVLASLLTACAAPHREARAPTPAEPATATAQRSATPASELLMQRVQVAMGALSNVAREWPQYGVESACVLVFSEQTEWLFNCPTAPTDDFVPTGQSLLGAPVFSAPSLTLGGPAEPYAKTKMLVGTVKPLKLKDATSGAETMRPVFLMHELEALGKNHPAFDPQSTTDEWLAIFVHEYFHGYQLFHPKVQALLGTWQRAESRDNLPAFYKQSAEYREAVKKEFDGLHAALAQPLDAPKAKAALEAWLALYRARLERFGPELERAKPGAALAKVDGFTMFLEGVARYIEMRFLVEPALRGQVDLKEDPRFKGFADFSGRAPTTVPGRNKVGSEYYYPLGMYVSFLLDVARPEWKRTVMDDPRLLVGEVEAAVARP